MWHQRRKKREAGAEKMGNWEMGNQEMRNQEQEAVDNCHGMMQNGSIRLKYIGLKIESR